MLHLIFLIVIGWLCYFLADYLEKRCEEEEKENEEEEEKDILDRSP